MRMVINGREVLRQWLPKIGPYLVIELALPGGTLLALLLYLYRRSQLGCARKLMSIRRPARGPRRYLIETASDRWRRRSRGRHWYSDGDGRRCRRAARGGSAESDRAARDRRRSRRRMHGRCESIRSAPRGWPRWRACRSQEGWFPLERRQRAPEDGQTLLVCARDQLTKTRNQVIDGYGFGRREKPARVRRCR